MDNFKKSELVISKILTLLMEWGIQSCNLKFDELDLDEKEFGPFFLPSIDWLVAENIIRISDVSSRLQGPSGGTVSNPVITSYGLQRLGQNIPVGDTNETLGNKVNRVSKDGSNYSNAGDFVGSLLASFTKSLSN
jgi:hypothetical protein